MNCDLRSAARLRCSVWDVVALQMIALFLLGTVSAAAAEGESPPMQKVRVSDDGQYFVLAESGKVFVPWGFNYLGEFGKLLEDSWDEDWPRVERDFSEMRKLGANVIRIHLQFSTYMKRPDEFDQAQLDHLRKLLDLGRDFGLYLDVTGLSCYRLDRIPECSTAILFACGRETL